MRFRKSVFGYILWAAYALSVCAALTFQADILCFRLGQRSFGMPLAVAGGSILLLFLILYLPLRAVCVRIRKKRREEGKDGGRKGAAVWECLLLLALESAAVLIRLQNGTAAAPLSAFVLEAAGLLCFYGALRLLSGRIAAAAASLGYALYPLISGTASEPGTAFFWGAGAVLLLLAALLLSLLSRKEAAVWPMACFTGLLMGGAVFWDISFFSCFLLALCGLFWLQEDAAVPRRARAAFLWLAVCACLAFAALGAFYMFVRGIDIGSYLSAWASLLSPSLLPSAPSWAFRLLPLSLLSILYVFGFFEEENRSGCIWLLPFLFLAGLFLLLGRKSGAEALLALFLLALVGNGLHSVCCTQPSAAPVSGADTSCGRKRDKRRRASGRLGTDAGSCKADVKTCGEEAPAPGSPLPTPLPMPAKRAHKPMEYAFEPREEEMRYDIETAAEDDFDLP